MRTRTHSLETHYEILSSVGSEFGGFKAVLIIDAEWLYSTVSLTVDREAKLFGQKPPPPSLFLSLSLSYPLYHR